MLTFSKLRNVIFMYFTQYIFNNNVLVSLPIAGLLTSSNPVISAIIIITLDLLTSAGVIEKDTRLLGRVNKGGRSHTSIQCKVINNIALKH